MIQRIDSLQDHPARPTQSLADHLGGVAETVQELLPPDETTIYEDDWQTVGKAIAWTHDAGKLTEYFAKYLETNDRSIAPRPEYTYHGFVSALLTSHVLYSLDISEEAQTAGFYAVAKHHSVVPTLRSSYDSYTGSAQRVSDQFEIARKQLHSIDDHAPEAADDLLNMASDGNLGWDDVFVDSPTSYQHLIEDPASLNDHFYETVLRAWSTLVCADKLDAAGIDIPASVKRPPVSTLRQKVAELPPGERQLDRDLNDLRSRAHQQSKTRILEQYQAGERFFRLTLPTGFGKTLTGLRASLELAEEQDGRVIYALPYTSILDQVDSVCQQFLEVEPTDQEYTVHHHLADTRTNVEELKLGDHVSDGSEVMYAETWQSGLVLTTFTQLFESIAGPGNTQSMKLPALQDSVILLDEPQGISIDWWGLVSRLTQFVNREYDATVIMMTATQPQIFERASNLPDPVPLTDETDACIDFLSSNPRVEFELHDSLTGHLDGSNTSPLSTEDAAHEILKTATEGSNTLAIVNTIESAATVTEDLYSQAGDADSRIRLADELCQFYRQIENYERDDPSTLATSYLEYLADRSEISEESTLIATLTTRLRPRDRSLLLSSLRHILDDTTSTPFDGCQTVTVSTQLIEAGVDISFDRLYRDFAPLPALVQAAGRCNREYDGTVGTVTVWRLASARSGGLPPSKLIYGQKSLLRPTRDAIDLLQRDQGSVIAESAMVSTGVDKYYQSFHQQRQTTERDDRLSHAFDVGDGDRLRNASLIDQQYETQDIVVLVSEADRKQFDRYRQLRDSDQWQAAKDAFTELKPLVVTVPVTDRSAGHDDEDTLQELCLSESREYYEIETGRGVRTDHISLDTER